LDPLGFSEIAVAEFFDEEKELMAEMTRGLNALTILNFNNYKFKMTVVLNMPPSAVKEKIPSCFTAIDAMLLVPIPWFFSNEMG
jgi:hypothetical protein